MQIPLFHLLNPDENVVTLNTLVSLRLALCDNALNKKRKSAVAFPLFILRLDKRLWVEICMHTVTQKCVKFDVVSMPGG